jgi:Kdo2-lipid IVA lauroyltransferase/acyltransferase
MPLSVMYVFTDIFYLLLMSIIPYRRVVVRQNIARSFPNLTVKEQLKIERKFYRHLTDLLAEGAKNMTISEKALRRRFKVSNPEVMQVLFDKNKSVLLVSGHYNNWEWLITFQNLLFSHQAVGIGMPMTSKFWDQKINSRRARFGMYIINSKNVNEFFTEEQQTPTATLVLADQAPGEARKSYWMNFLNQPTPVIFGPEQLANKYNQAVVFFHTEKVKRGHYTMHLELITENPLELSWGKTTEAHTVKLEKIIKATPQFWIWSHKRWKREIPEDLEDLKKEQEAKFNNSFRSK